VPADVVPAVRAVAFEPAPARFCVACCILTGPTPVPRAILDASQPLHYWTAMTPCGHRAGGAPARCLPEIASAGGPAAVATTTLAATAAASVAAPVGGSPRLPRPSIREIPMNELRDLELWTDVPAELRKRVARLMHKLLCKFQDARDDDAKGAAFLDLFLMPVAVLHRLLPGEAGTNSPARQAQSLVERLRLTHAGIEMMHLWQAAQAATADCRRRRGTSKPAPVHSALHTRRIQKNVMVLCLQGRYRRALCLLDRNPLLDLRVPENLQRVRDLHPHLRPSCFPGLGWAARCAYAVCRCGRSEAASDGQLLCRWSGFSLCAIKLVLAESLPDSTGGEILCPVAQMFANGEMPADIMPLFSSATVLATPKPTGGVHPLAIGMNTAQVDIELSPAACDIHGARVSAAPTCCWREIRM
jgi:hypothetical protein